MNIVCGGVEFWDSEDPTDSCEMNIGGTMQWTYTSSLPRPLTGLRGVTLDNRIFMTGGGAGDEGNFVVSNEILELVELEDSVLEWKVITNLKKGRVGHAVSLIPVSDYWQYCKAQ